jgi:two-component system LytT family response regulator
MIQQTRSIQALLIDKEIDACAQLQQLLSQNWSDKIDVFGCASSTEEAEKMMAQIQPDVVFIDIELPNENAFQFFERISPFDFEIIFVTDHDAYALQALKLNAIDYILKPICIAELSAAIRKLDDRLTLREVARLYQSADYYKELQMHLQQKDSPDKIVLKSQSGIFIIRFRDIVYVEAKGSYSNFYYFVGKKLRLAVASQTIVSYEAILPEHIFYRIHKSYLVNTQYIKYLKKEGQNELILLNDITIPVSRRRWNDLVQFLQQ